MNVIGEDEKDMADNEALKDKYQDDRIIAQHNIGMKLDQAKDTAVEKMFGRENKPSVDGRIRNYMKD